ncbi:MAG: C10 family peptidase [Rikenellaceae bacterium]|nr:C10 family peptidase [Rikenellaceae bacterium]
MKTCRKLRHSAAGKTVLLLFLVALCSLLSCAKSDVGEPSVPDIRTSYTSNVVVGEDGNEMTALENYILRLDAEAGGNYRLTDEEIANTVLSFASGGVGSSSGIQPLSAAGINIKGIAPLRNEPVMMLSVENDRSPVSPLVVEFDGPEGEGFAVCSGDKRYEKVFCYVPKGDIADTANLELLKYFFRSVEYDVTDSISKFNAKIDSLTLLGYRYDTAQGYSTYYLPPGMVHLGYQFDIEGQGEASLDMKTRWHQFSPYNDSMDERGAGQNFYVDPDNNRAVVGCAPLALGQAMAYKKSPCFPNIYPKWDAIRSFSDIKGTGYEKDVADFFKELTDQLHVKFTVDGTAAQLGNVRAFFQNHGIKHQEKTNVRYSTRDEKMDVINFVYDACNQKEPVVIEEKIADSYLSHVFVICGVKFAYGLYFEVLGTETEFGGMNKMYNLLGDRYELYIDCNFGWKNIPVGRFSWDNIAVGKTVFDGVNNMYTFQ